jgi:hypothetical protein
MAPSKSFSMASREQLADQLLSLPAEDRIYLLTALQHSLEGESTVDDDVASAWAGEAERRIAAYERGESQAMEWRAALDQIREQVAERLASGRA